MSTQVMKIKLSKRFYIFSIIFGLLLGALFSSPLIRPLAKNFIKDVDESMYTYPSGEPNTSAYFNAVMDARDAAESAVAPFVLLVGGIFFVLVFILVGRHRQPVSIDEDGVYVWNWFGKKQHLWANYQDKSIIHAKSVGLKVAKFEQFHFSTGTVSLKTKRLQHGEDVLVKMYKMTNKA